MMMRQILLIDPQCEQPSPLRTLLTDEGFHVDVVSTGTGAIQQLGEADYVLVLLDRDLPDTDGIDLCQHIRSRSRIPLMMLSMRNAAPDRIRAFKAGADDYLGKPVVPGELLARMWATLRRSGAHATSHSAGDFVLDLATNTVVRVRDRVEVVLTLREMRLLHFLTRHPRRSLSTGGLGFK